MSPRYYISLIKSCRKGKLNDFLRITWQPRDDAKQGFVLLLYLADTCICSTVCKGRAVLLVSLYPIP